MDVFFERIPSLIDVLEGMRRRPDMYIGEIESNSDRALISALGVNILKSTCASLRKSLMIAGGR
jgi:hypothetical protein